MSDGNTGLQLRSLLKKSGELEISLASVPTPAPSLPTGSDWSSRAAIIRRAASGIFAVTTGASAPPETLAVDMSAGPIRSPRSDGLIGVASTRTTTSSSAGSGVGTSTSDSSSSPLFLSSERS